MRRGAVDFGEEQVHGKVVAELAKLSEKQKRFVDEYLVNLNATQAAIRAGYSERSAETIGYENLRKPQIAAEIAKRQTNLQKKLGITQERVLNELAAIAFANAADFVQIDREGMFCITPTCDLAEDKRRALATIKNGRNGVEIKTHDKVRALEMLGKHLGLFRENAETDIEDVAAIRKAVFGG